MLILGFFEGFDDIKHVRFALSELKPVAVVCILVHFLLTKL